MATISWFCGLALTAGALNVGFFFRALTSGLAAGETVVSALLLTSSVVDADQALYLASLAGGRHSC